MLLSNLFSVIGLAHLGPTGGCRLLLNFSVAVTVESIFRHWSGSTVFVSSSISVLRLLSSLFSVFGRAHSGLTGSFRLLQNFSADVTVESIFRHWSGPLGFNWLLSFHPVFQC